MKIIDCVQMTPPWFSARRGVPTASEFSKLLTPVTLQPSQSADKYIYELIAEQLGTDPPIEANFISVAMRDGIEYEAEARRWYAMERDCDVQQVGFCLTDDGRFGASPDGLVGTEGGLELKVPKTKTHVGYVLNGAGVPPEYIAQVHGNLIVTGRQWWDFMSYCREAPDRSFIVRVTPDSYTTRLREAMESFWTRYQELLAAFLGNHE